MNNKLRGQFHKAYIKADMDKLKYILSEDLPRSLIKFCNGSYNKEDGSNYYLDTLRNNTLWLSSPREFNDPFDCALNIDYKKEMGTELSYILTSLFGEEEANKLCSTRETDTLLSAKADEVREALKERDNSIINNVFVSCFSEVVNLLSLRMWGHYANSHRGFCMEYDFGEMNRIFKEGVIPILYDDTYWRNDKCKSEEECREFRLQCTFTKSLEWEYEKEWRMLKTDESATGRAGCTIPFLKPEKVYMGCKIEDGLKEDLKTICAEQGIVLYQMRMKPGTFKLEYERE